MVAGLLDLIIREFNICKWLILQGFSVLGSKVSRFKFLTSGQWFLSATEGCPTLQFSSVLCSLKSVFRYLTSEPLNVEPLNLTATSLEVAVALYHPIFQIANFILDDYIHPPPS